MVLAEKMSDTKILNNGLPQGFVLATLLFSLYLSDLPTIEGGKFCYPVDLTLAAQLELTNKFF